MTEQEVERARADIAALWENRARGDLPERTFQKESERRVLDLCRALVRQRTGPDESILAEHHVVSAHTKIAGSVLRESEQEFVSLLATEKRVFRLRAILAPEQPVLFLDGEKDAVEELSYASASGIVVHRKWRAGEIAAGLTIAAFALLGRSFLQVTSTALFLLGIAGALHGLLMPTRWAVILERAPAVSPSFEVWALRKRSARALLRVLRSRIPKA